MELRIGKCWMGKHGETWRARDWQKGTDNIGNKRGTIGQLHDDIIWYFNKVIRVIQFVGFFLKLGLLILTFLSSIDKLGFKYDVHSVTIFEAYLKNSLQFSEVIFSHFGPHFWLIFVEKGNLLFLDSKIWWSEKSEQFALSCSIASTLFDKITLRPL